MNQTFFSKPDIDPKFKQSLLNNFVATYEKNVKHNNKFVTPFAFGFATLLIAILINLFFPQPNQPLTPTSTVSIENNNQSFSENTVSFINSMKTNIESLLEKDNSINNLSTDLISLESEINADPDILSAINFDKLD